VGRILAEDLLRQGDVKVRVWDHQFANAQSKASGNLRNLQSSFAIEVANDPGSAAAHCQLILSAVTADQALAAARSILPGIEDNAALLELNSISPAAKQMISEEVALSGGHFVEASIMSPIMPRRSDAPILLCGPHATDLQPAMQKLGFGDVSVVSPNLGVASATKMCRSVIVKGMEALVTESLLAARHYGVEGAVISSLDNLFPRPDWPEHARYLISRSLEHGTRRAEEMREAVSYTHLTLPTILRVSITVVALF